MLLENGFENIVGIDPSVLLLKFARSSLGPSFCPVIGVAEHLPFRTGSVGAIITCFSLRDSADLDHSLEEFARSTRRGGALAIVDIGKPDSGFWEGVIGLYISYVMPILARLWIRRRTTGNPFRMIIPTWKRLLTNKRLSERIERIFGPCALKSFFLGGLVVFEADRFAVLNDILR